MIARHRAPRRRPAKGSPFTLAEHFLTTLLVAGFLMVGVLTVAFVAQDLDPEQNVCEVGWDCGNH